MSSVSTDQVKFCKPNTELLLYSIWGKAVVSSSPAQDAGTNCPLCGPDARPLAHQDGLLWILHQFMDRPASRQGDHQGCRPETPPEHYQDDNPSSKGTQQWRNV